MEHVTISYSNGRGKYGQQFAYVRPSGKCSNRSRRCAADKVQDVVSKHFPVVNYYKINGWIIGAKNENFALKEYYRICDVADIGKSFEVVLK